jgi:hypothetical protein
MHEPNLISLSLSIYIYIYSVYQALEGLIGLYVCIYLGLEKFFNVLGIVLT